MSAIGPGDFVECVEVFSKADMLAFGAKGTRAFRRGNVYRVLGTNGGLCVRCRKLCGGLSFGHVGPGSFFISCAFRPIYRPKSEFLETLLRKTDIPVKEDA